MSQDFLTPKKKQIIIEDEAINEQSTHTIMLTAMTSNDEMRKQILEILYYYECKNPGGFGPTRDILLELLRKRQGTDVSENSMDFNVLYLADKNLVKLGVEAGSLWHISNITFFGIDVVERAHARY